MSFPISFGRYLSWITIAWLGHSIDFCFSNELVKLYEKECNGSDVGLHHPGNSSSRFTAYREMYTNCTFVNSNLEIVFLEESEEQYDLSFLKDIREVRGYVLIYGNHMSKIPLPGLRVIRGVQLFQLQKNDTQPSYGLYVAQNYLPGNDSVGLRELQLTSLAEILSGDVVFKDNKYMCFGEYMVNWNYIFNRRTAHVWNFGLTGYNNPELCSERCHQNCTAYDMNRYCWGSGADMCQTVMQCRGCVSRRCWAPDQCCHSQCSAGCTGPDSSECLACHSFTDNNRCVGQCNETYNGTVKCAYQERCVTQCPENMGTEEYEYFEYEFSIDVYREYVECDGTCPQTCLGNSTLLDGKNIDIFANCEVLNGSLRITNATFYGEAGVEPVEPIYKLYFLSELEEITGSLTIEAWPEILKGLDYLKNVKTIGGQTNGNDEYALKITGTSLEYLGLSSLKEVKEGDIYVSGNSKLCYTNTMNWNLLFKNDSRQKAIVTGNKDSEEDNDCSPCSHRCSAGCWGPTIYDCMYCPRFILNKSCVDECPFGDGFYESPSRYSYNFYSHDERECLRCHDECNGTCSKGGGPAGCDKCKNVRHQNECKPECPQRHYADQMKVCRKCHSACQSCTGNSSRLSVNGCKMCSRGILRIEDENIKYCILSIAECGEDYYVSSEEIKTSDNSTSTLTVCKKCHPQCKGCLDMGPTACKECRNLKQILD